MKVIKNANFTGHVASCLQHDLLGRGGGGEGWGYLEQRLARDHNLKLFNLKAPIAEQRVQVSLANFPLLEQPAHTLVGVSRAARSRDDVAQRTWLQRTGLASCLSTA